MGANGLVRGVGCGGRVARREKLQKRGDGGTGFMQMAANEGAETARLGMPLHSPLGVGCGRLDPSQGLRVPPWVMVEWPGGRAFSCSLSLAG